MFVALCSWRLTFRCASVVYLGNWPVDQVKQSSSTTPLDLLGTKFGLSECLFRFVIASVPQVFGTLKWWTLNRFCTETISWWGCRWLKLILSKAYRWANLSWPDIHRVYTLWYSTMRCPVVSCRSFAITWSCSIHCRTSKIEPNQLALFNHYSWFHASSWNHLWTKTAYSCLLAFHFSASCLQNRLLLRLDSHTVPFAATHPSTAFTYLHLLGFRFLSWSNYSLSAAEDSSSFVISFWALCVLLLTFLAANWTYQRWCRMLSKTGFAQIAFTFLKWRFNYFALQFFFLTF